MEAAGGDGGAVENDSAAEEDVTEAVAGVIPLADIAPPAQTASDALLPVSSPSFPPASEPQNTSFPALPDSIDPMLGIAPPAPTWGRMASASVPGLPAAGDAAAADTAMPPTTPASTTPATQPAATPAAPIVAPAATDAAGSPAPSLPGQAPADATAESKTHGASAESFEALARKAADAPTAQLPPGDDAAAALEPAKPGVESSSQPQTLNAPQPMPERLAHLTPAAPAAHTGQAATAETTAAVSLAGLALEIAARAQSGHSRFEIRLDPPELGRIDVRLDVDQRGQVTSRLVVEKAETLDLLKRDAPELERALQQAGLKTSDNGLQFALRDQAFAGRDDRPAQQMARVVVPDAELPPVETVQSGYGRWLRADGGLDIRV